MRNYPLDAQGPIAGIVRGPWLETVMEQDERENPRINRHAYEMCVLLAVRERLRSKELWSPEPIATAILTEIYQQTSRASEPHTTRL